MAQLKCAHQEGLRGGARGATNLARDDKVVVPMATAGLAFNGTTAETRLQIGACQGTIGHGAGLVG